VSRQTQKKLLSIVTWLLVEIVLNFFGLDDLFDCSEFIFDSKVTINCDRDCQLMLIT
jgi:hypothetical protein